MRAFLMSVVLLVVPLAGHRPMRSASLRSNAASAPSSLTSQALIQRSPGERNRLAQASRHILLNVLVTDARGKPVAGLKLNDFSLRDNNHPLEIESARFVEGRNAAAPVHVMLVLDALNNSSRSYAFERKEIEKFLGRNEGRLVYPVSLVSLTDSGIHTGEASRDGNALIAESRRLSVVAHTSNAVASESGDVIQGVGRNIYATVEGPGRVRDMNQRFTLSVPALLRIALEQEDVSGRALVIWIGPGWPPLTGPDFLAAMPEVHANYFSYIVDLNTALRESQVTLDDVSTPALSRDAEIHKGDDEPFLPAVTGASHAESGNLALSVLASQSGGRVLDTSKDLAGEIDACIADADAYYVLSFNAAAGASVDEYHSLEIRVSQPGLTVRANRGYYAQP